MKVSDLHEWTRGKSLEFKRAIYGRAAGLMADCLHPEEVALSRLLVRRLGPVAGWYHGGIGGLSAGDTLLPRTRLDPGLHPGLRATTEAHGWVYFSQMQECAGAYARRPGAVYQVAPDSEVEVDPADLRRFWLLWHDPELRASGGNRAVLTMKPVQFRARSATILRVVQDTTGTDAA